ncbi:MAG: YbaN family protein [Albidovulum sp.]|uniref:YbaN family protein n=1 Tax=Albidovulum sp. TaxID=1872424 RepID=UPI003C9D87BF
MIRSFWLIGGGLALAFGAIGIFLPLLPTVPFLLLAAFCFARGSERLHDWLLSHPVFGPPIENWRDRGAIGRRAKWAATISILAAFMLAALFGAPLPALIIQVIVLGCVSIFIWTRPDG